MKSRPQSTTEAALEWRGGMKAWRVRRCQTQVVRSNKCTSVGRPKPLRCNPASSTPPASTKRGPEQAAWCKAPCGGKRPDCSGKRHVPSDKQYACSTWEELVPNPFDIALPFGNPAAHTPAIAEGPTRSGAVEGLASEKDAVVGPPGQRTTAETERCERWPKPRPGPWRGTELGDRVPRAPGNVQDHGLGHGLRAPQGQGLRIPSAILEDTNRGALKDTSENC
mmetsp:Transcript_172334/g.547194  ORF Transcript_172334/g.547194 Transcript_172334/m.547194 type:complete len:223 (+) Transcript_172334:538-1206(+)